MEDFDISRVYVALLQTYSLTKLAVISVQLFCREKPEPRAALDGVVVDKPKFGASTKSTGK